MFTYIDETGNTGGNLFDPEQPWFATIALMTKANFDVLEHSSMTSLHMALGGSDIHANSLGGQRIEWIALPLLARLKRRDGRFLISRVEKHYLAATKIVDTVFDSYENRAVPWHVYNLRPLKLILLFKLTKFVLSEQMMRMFWDSLMEKNHHRASERFVEACKAILSRVSLLPDQRSREIEVDPENETAG
jgi:hypothetical protein